MVYGTFGPVILKSKPHLLDLSQIIAPAMQTIGQSPGWAGAFLLVKRRRLVGGSGLRQCFRRGIDGLKLRGVRHRREFRVIGRYKIKSRSKVATHRAMPW